MRRLLVVAGLGYLSIAIIIGIHDVIVQPNGDRDAVSFELIDRAARWPITIFD
jgi:hypothetical protein